jgi:hypothetical protein
MQAGQNPNPTNDLSRTNHFGAVLVERENLRTIDLSGPLEA